ncbi:unnamed protein product [Amoebophrya sp. A25]|nr:unnamed protein product [Amoebophrya sp. A25]|eukprot:GSA25T00011769001.1
MEKVVMRRSVHCADAIASTKARLRLRRRFLPFMEARAYIQSLDLHLTRIEPGPQALSGLNLFRRTLREYTPFAGGHAFLISWDTHSEKRVDLLEMRLYADEESCTCAARSRFESDCVCSI